VHRVEALGLGARQEHHACGDHAQPGRLEARENLADDVLLYRVGFDDGERALERHFTPSFQEFAILAKG
jgi:hypothetical protein